MVGCLTTNNLPTANPADRAKNFPVVGTGVDPVTSRFSGARSTN
jgi:hypothetical protein